MTLMTQRTQESGHRPVAALMTLMTQRTQESGHRRVLNVRNGGTPDELT
jgi:hypothetical protein